ncbi:D-alanyl-D-alanine carboxypeptidase family protein [Corynebacterium sp. MNWGS58]|uniref:D-alanyl-D-alanine carboxypeptidase family protein n=1 Tax=Corynebacterium sp. 102791.4 TaxID=3104612 RepID=UPI003511A534
MNDCTPGRRAVATCCAAFVATSIVTGTTMFGALETPLGTPYAHAQQEEPTPLEGPADDANGASPGEQAPEPLSREEAPDTSSCPNRVHPPKARTTSEAVAPGDPSPTPLPPLEKQNCGVSTAPGFQVDESVLASAWLVADIDSGEIIAHKDPHGRYRPASIIKALLALVAIKELDLDKTVTVTQESADQVGSRVGIGANGEYTVEQLLHGLLLASGNDAAHALAQELGGDEATLRKINELADELGTTDTYAASYSGLDAPGNSASAYDLGLIYRAAYQDPTFDRIVNTEFIEFPGFGEHEGFEVWNDNHLFLYDPDGMGGKTGYTDDANHTFVGALNRDGRRLMAIILDTTVDKARAWEQAQKLLHAGFAVPPGTEIGELTPIADSDTEPGLTEGATPAPQDSVDASADGDTENVGGASDSDVPAWAALVGVLTVIVAGAGTAAIGGFFLRRRK